MKPTTSSPARIVSIALVNPLGDYGIQNHTRELAAALAAHGKRVDLYCSSTTIEPEAHPSRPYRMFAVLGGVLLKQRGKLASGVEPCFSEEDSSAAAGRAEREGPSRIDALSRLVRARLRRALLGPELAIHLKRCRYDIVWTQWPSMDDYGTAFWSWCRGLGLTLVHSVHNVHPHEPTAEAVAVSARVYRLAHALVVHSESTKAELTSLYPDLLDKVVVSRIGTYTLFPRRPEARQEDRARLGIAEGQCVVLFPGLIRPYKNLDAVLRALRDDRCRDVVLVVAGRESGYENSNLGDPLGRTRLMAERLGVSGRVKLISGNLPGRELAGLLEAADAVILPYVKSYGSAQLLLAMTFGKYIIATRTGGMDEYLAGYNPCELLPSPHDEHVAAAMARASHHCATNPQRATPPMDHLQWRNIAEELLRTLETRLTKSGGVRP